MILQKLNDLYPYLEKDNSYDIAPEGYSNVSISFIIEIETDGSFQILDNREGEGNRRHGRPMIVPGPKAHSNKIEAFPFRDTATYLLGYHQGSGNPENTRKRFEAAKAFHIELSQTLVTEETEAIARFFENKDASNWVPEDPSMLTNSGVFRLRGKPHFVHESPDVCSWWVNKNTATAEEHRFCLITGKYLPIALIHSPAIGGNMPSPAQSKAPIVAFNKGKSAFESYGNNNDQGLNAPVSEEAATQYCKALNALLADERHRIQIGDATTVFWTEQLTPSQFTITRFFSDNTSIEDDDAKAQDALLLDALKSQTHALRQGIPSTAPLPDNDATYHILGLTGQAGGRIGIRFHHTATIGHLLEKIAQHHNDLSIVKEWDDSSQNPNPDFISLRHLLLQTKREQKESKKDKIAPNLGGQLMQSILNGTPYPVMLAHGILRRLKASERLNYTKAAILKGFLNRNHFTKNKQKPMTESLDPTRTEPAYHLGRLFAVYETAQKHAHDWKLERTIRESMYSSASATPLAVFGRLERLHHHHTAKKRNPPGSSDSYADIVGEIKQNFKGNTPIYPASLGLIDQSLFAVGYYHQLQHFKQLSNSKKQTTESNN